MKKLKLGFPKGSLQNATVELFKKAGTKISISSRSYYLISDDDELEIMLVRSQEMAKYVQDGFFDAGLTGFDWICESGAKVEEVCELNYAKSGFRSVRWVLAVTEDSKIKSIKDLEGKRVATELINYTKKYFAKNKIKADIEFSWGATEAKAGKLVDAIVELTETGSSLRANKLRVIDEMLSSTTRFIANDKALNDNWKKEKIENMAMLLKGALATEGMVGLKMNVPLKFLEKVIVVLPAHKKPTISQLSDREWIALDIIIEERTVKKIIPALKRSGAADIIEYPLNKIIY
ncbi:ATP phosphoribosyltransferase [Endomicrobiia bacterium]|nr:ATP phosphoribosyltransferase [Endomicrobiia bacterium]GHT12892.1 ATP phosphoribosyltransferase [Endomicrobiia bacterium]GHT18492.1 ATP phosphoribosyltransferase [Endomicrobiia bacterium]GHT29126.1 ATP phosphoribosyltransferase [Endomicrobiia bacterium]GHT30741.1 ATP phosphoribosyltransferase [Endomicrobiia bacterium]